MTDSPSAANTIVTAVGQTHDALEAQRDRKFQELGVLPQWQALLLNIRLSPGVSTSKLTRLMQLSPKSVEGLVADMESVGLVERRSHPVRSSVQELYLTEKGRVSLVAVQGINADLEQLIRSRMGSGDIEQLLAGLNRLKNSISGH